MLVSILTGLPNDENLKRRVHEVDRWTDEPVKIHELGPRHRVLRHSREEAAAQYGLGSVEQLIHDLHVTLDYSVTKSKKLARKR